MHLTHGWYWHLTPAKLVLLLVLHHNHQTLLLQSQLGHVQ